MSTAPSELEVSARPPGLDELCDRISAYMQTDGVPGFALALVQDDEIAWSRGFGVSSVDDSAAVTPATVFRIGSITKPLTAATVLAVVEAGHLELDAPVGAYLEGAGRGITLRGLLSHTSGLPAEADGVRELRDVLLHLTPNSPAPTTPRYSNLGVAVAACLAELATGRAFAELLTTTVLAPIGMSSTALEPAAGAIVAGHDYDDVPAYAPARGALSTSIDLARFALALLGGGGLSAGTVDAMQTLHAPHSPGRESGFGLGLEVHSYRGVRVVGHTGDVGAYKSWLLVAPEHRVAVAALCNRPPMYRLTAAPYRALDVLLGLREDRPWATPWWTGEQVWPGHWRRPPA